MSKQTDNNRVATDAELERGTFQIGRTVHLSSVTHAYRGTLESITESVFVLKNAHLVESTGPLDQYAKTKKASEESPELKGVTIFISRGALAWGMQWD